VTGRARKPEVVNVVRNAFLDAAAQAFAESGYVGTSLREVAQAAGYTAPALYLYFKNKQALYQALLDRVNAQVAELIAALPPANRLTFEQRVEHWTRELFEFVAARAAVFQVVGTVAAGASSPPSRSAALRQSRLLAQRDEKVGAWLAGGKPFERLGSFTAAEAAAFFRVLTLHFWMQWSSESQANARAAGPFVDRAQLAARLFLYGVSGQPTGANEAPPAERRRTPSRRGGR
jgi:AcrR family transcriptional regulator